mmetsp:Transcript_11744/g.10381  ORF Transcript_11744/g.10381 Transcript_11744/m.10381 type:complete len:124 (-) Transcript_11744:42-413(-)
MELLFDSVYVLSGYIIGRYSKITYSITLRSFVILLVEVMMCLWYITFIFSCLDNYHYYSGPKFLLIVIIFLNALNILFLFIVIASHKLREGDQEEGIQNINIQLPELHNTVQAINSPEIETRM